MWNADGWEASKRRFAAFWEGGLVDRCCVSITAPSNRQPPPFTRSTNLEVRWLDFEYRLAEFLHELEGAWYGGDGFPLWQNVLGAGALASILGTPFVLAEDTVWVDKGPVVDRWENRPALRFREESEMWRIVRGLTEHFCANAKGRFLNGITDIGGSLDTGTAVRGSERLLMDFYDHPGEVERLSEEIDAAWFECYERLSAILARQGDWIGSWMPIWCPGRWYALQCDVAAMISPGQFERFVAPGLARQAAWLDHCFFHLDGHQAIPHLDIVLGIERIAGIEWVAGPPELIDRGAPEYYPLFQRVRDRGKLLVVRNMWPESMVGLIDEFGPEGMFLSTHCRSEEEGRALLAAVEGASGRAAGRKFRRRNST
jgi:hypothetical protein